MTERTKTIKGLISGKVDMGTFGLVELELLAIEKENEALRKHAVMQRSEQLTAFLEWYWEEVDGRPFDARATDIVDGG